VAVALHIRFFQSAEMDLEAARILTNANHSQLALYHLQQAFEKCVKSYYILKETIENKTPESEIYKKLKKLGHDTQESTIELLGDIADKYKENAEKALADIQKI
jgi:HEPN domain-containing protein